MRILYLFALATFLLGCDGFGITSIRDICSENPTMCSDLNQDAWCQSEKSLIIRNRYALSQQVSEQETYNLMVNFENYRKCITPASKIEYIKDRKKETSRKQGLITAENELKRLKRETKNSSHPPLLYYHWSRFNDDSALEKLLNLEQQGELENPEMQVAMASYYIKRDLDKATEVLLHALSLYPAGAEVDTDIFRGLSAIYLKTEDFAKAYIWAYVGREFKMENLDLAQIETVLLKQNVKLAALVEKAEDYIEAIEDGRFSGQL
jgi:hypothetical protein